MDRGVAAGVWAPRGRGTRRGRWGRGVRAGGRSAAGSRTPTCCSPAPTSTQPEGRRATARSTRSSRSREAQPRDPGHVAHTRPARHRQPRRDRRRGVRSRPRGCSRCSMDHAWIGRSIGFRSSASSRCRSPRPHSGMQGPRSTSSSTWPPARWGWARAERSRSARRRRRRWPQSGRVPQRGAGAVLPGDRRRVEVGVRGRRTGRRVQLRSGLRLAATHAVRTSLDVARAMYDLAGGFGVYDHSPLQRRFRDAHTATAHFQVNEASRELPGRILLGLSADPSML